MLGGEVEREVEDYYSFQLGLLSYIIGKVEKVESKRRKRNEENMIWFEMY